ncbi:MAG: hypothetical protein CMF70_06730 [Magnetovibrio sp.]|nr:hypothetical protein [Magnetovibrio sp.]
MCTLDAHVGTYIHAIYIYIHIHIGKLAARVQRRIMFVRVLSTSVQSRPPQQRCCGVFTGHDATRPASEAMLAHIVAINTPAKVWVCLSLGARVAEHWSNALDDNVDQWWLQWGSLAYVVAMFLGTLWYSNYWGSPKDIATSFSPTVGRFGDGLKPWVLGGASLYYWSAASFFAWAAEGPGGPWYWSLAAWNAVVALFMVLTIFLL